MVRWLLLFLTVMSNASFLEGGVWDSILNKFRGDGAPPPPSIKILIAHDIEKVKIDVTGKYSLFDPYTNSHITSRFVGKSREIQAMHDGLKWGEAFPGLYQIMIKPDEQATVTRVEGNEYPGSVYVYDIGGTISLVNQIPVEDYVRYIFPEFSDDSLHPEVLAAIAIVIRTNAYYQASNPKNTYWAVDASKIDYKGRYAIPYAVDSAVNTTRYMIMSRTGVYEGMATPFAAQFDDLSPKTAGKDLEVSKISINEANEMANRGAHAAQILAKAFPGSTIMLMHYSN